MLRRALCDHTYFTEISTEERAYWLGFFGADGCVYRNALILDLKDVEHVARFRSALGINNPVRERVRTSNYGRQEHAVVGTTSRQLISDLARHGVRKGRGAACVPAALSEHLLRHYWRGWVDGDGTLSLTGKVLTLGLVGSEAICCGFASFCRTVVTTQARVRRHKSIWCFTLSDRAARRVGEVLYRDAAVYLKRKYDVLGRAVELNPSRVLKHSATGYRRGCRCEVCIIGHRHDARQRRARRVQAIRSRAVVGETVRWEG
jgi:hypothetical protein